MDDVRFCLVGLSCCSVCVCVCVCVCVVCMYGQHTRSTCLSDDHASEGKLINGDCLLNSIKDWPQQYTHATTSHLVISTESEDVHFCQLLNKPKLLVCRGVVQAFVTGYFQHNNMYHLIHHNHIQSVEYTINEFYFYVHVHQDQSSQWPGQRSNQTDYEYIHVQE